MEQKAIRLNGTGVVTSEGENGCVKFFEFLPSERAVQVVQPTQTTGKAQLMRDGTIYFKASPKRIRNNSLLICKAAHGRLSGTRDHAVQLTLKAFAVEGIDWQRTFVEETVDVMANLMGAERMIEVLNRIILNLKNHD